FRCNFILGTAGRFEESISLTMRVIPSAIPSLDSLNIEPELKAALLPQQGLGLVCGATGSGKSTLLAAIYRYCQDNFPDRVIVTYEDPVEYILGRDTDLLKPHQSQIGRHVPGFAEGIRAGMRRNPDLIGVGEIRDQETAEAAIAAGESGHVCLATCHTHSPGETISRMLGLLPVQSRDGMAHALLGTLSFIVVQVLVRTRDGRRRAVREFITFDTALRSALGQLPHEKWGEHIDNIILLEKRRIADQVATLYRRHDITREEACLFIPHHEWSRLPDA
ncbi:TPA: plasmid transfer ATPase TraJ, partial [Escherichia coli]|nr:plasmid transfer ATPase TraJ [Escherichia coli]